MNQKIESIILSTNKKYSLILSSVIKDLANDGDYLKKVGLRIQNLTQL